MLRRVLAPDPGRIGCVLFVQLPGQDVGPISARLHMQAASRRLDAAPPQP